MNDFLKRLPTTIGLLTFTFVVIEYLPPNWFALILFVIISLAAVELIKLAKPNLSSYVLALANGALIGCSFTFSGFDLMWALFFNLVLIGLYFLFFLKTPEQLTNFVRDFGIQILVVVYVYFPLFFMLELKKTGAHYLFFLIGIIAIGDSGAYFIGRLLGKRHIYPVASPKKTLEGLIAAVITAALGGYLLLLVFPISSNKWLAIVTAAAIGLISQVSDPIESLFKRAANVKDSSGLLPGHGGILDRLDSYIFCAPVFTFIVKYIWK